MEKRKLINLVISSILTIIAIATHTIKFFIIGILLLVVIVDVLARLLHVQLANKYYKYLLANTAYIKQVEHERYKTYFMLSGKELEEKICQYDKHLLRCYDYSKSLIDFLKDFNKYLSKEKYDNVLEIAKAEIRETGRV